MSSVSTSSLGLKISKTVAISSLGLYAGLLTTSSVVNIYSPIDAIKKTMNTIYCRLGESGCLLGTVATAAFTVSYFLSKDVSTSQEKTNLFVGLLAAPASGLYLWVSSKVVNCMSKFCKNQNKNKVEVELPPNHPSIYNEKGEKLQCPFSSNVQKDSEDTDNNCISKIIPVKLLSHFNPFFQSMRSHVFIASIMSIIPFSQIIFSKA